MDIGTGGYTEFDVHPGVVTYMCENPELLDCQMGLIHSHNKMTAFFSGTDTATLREEGSKRNHFVSLIVNNAGQYTAGITRQLEAKRVITESFSFGTFQDEIVEGSREYEVSGKEVQWCNLEIEKKEVRPPFRDIDERISEIMEEKKKVVTEKPLSVSSYNPKKEYSYQRGTVEKYSTKQPTLFDFDTDFMDSEPPFNYPIVPLTDKLIKSLLLQLITGSIIIADDSKIVPRKWAITMEKLFDKRFESIKLFEAWAEQFCEFLVYYPSSEYNEYGDEEYAQAVSMALITELKRLPQNKYIKEFINILAKWTEL